MMTAETSDQWETVCRVVFPLEDAEQTLPLYAIDWTRPRLHDAAVAVSAVLPRAGLSSMDRGTFQDMVRSAGSSCVTCDSFRVLDRTSVRILPGGHTSFCTFFNAFPAAYWRRWTRVETVRFQAEVSGRGCLRLFRSTGRGLIYQVSDGIVCDGRKAVRVDIPMSGLMDGGYFWFDAEAEGEAAAGGNGDAVKAEIAAGQEVGEEPASGLGLRVSGASWSVPASDRTQAIAAHHETTFSIAITTFNRAPYCMRQLKTLAGAEALRQRLDAIYCVDQGTDLVRDQEDFASVSADLGESLVYLRQGNLGGSGGFSRGMYETVKAGRSDYVLILDDDAISEPESILRAVQFEDYAIKPLLTGGAMFHLDNRTTLYTQGERLNPRTIWNAPSLGLDYNFDFAVRTLRDTPERHQRVDSDYNGWWMCLIPVSIIKEIGLSQPFFLKFDDVEFCMRARRHGYPTVCLPGVAVWHQAWHDKDPTRGWDEYYIQRNRWLAALLISPDKPVDMAMVNLRWDTSVGLRFLYSAMRLHTLGLADILRGPEYIVATLPTKLAQIRQERSRFADAQASTDPEAFPEAEQDLADRGVRRQQLTMKDYLKAVVRYLGRMALGSRAQGRDEERPALSIPAQDASWMGIAMQGVDSALVTTPDGNGRVWLRRDDRLARRIMTKNARLTCAIIRKWKDLARWYADYDMASFQVWERIFQENPAVDEK